ncbi:unnamed protein product [Caenorhabditis sp. 36 PRJEB53466]|nr:unnamed protein product [Caenorhabditis sp. 36 PRJEB53466]
MSTTASAQIMGCIASNETEQEAGDGALPFPEEMVKFKAERHVHFSRTYQMLLIPMNGEEEEEEFDEPNENEGETDEKNEKKPK